MGAVAAIAVGSPLVGGYLQGVAAKRQAEAQAKILERNAEIARQNAGYVQSIGQQQAGLARDKAFREIAKAQVAAAAGGVALDSGSLNDIVAGSWSNAEVRVQSLLNDSWRRAWGLEVQADTMEFQAKQTRKEGDAAMYASFIGGGAKAGVSAFGAGGGVPPVPEIGPEQLGSSFEDLPPSRLGNSEWWNS